MTEIREDFEVCNCNVVHQETVNKVRKNMLDDRHLYDLAELFKIFGDSTRINILNALNISEMCVCDIAAALDMKQSAISHQLRVLKQSKLVKYRKEGKAVYYSLDDQHVNQILNQGLIHLDEKR